MSRNKRKTNENEIKELKPKKVKRAKVKKEKVKKVKPKKIKEDKLSDYGLKKDDSIKMFSASNIINFLIYASAILAFAYIHMLKPIFIVILLVLIALVMPFSFRADYIYEFQKNKFYEYTTYLKYINVNYKIKKKVDGALQDTKEIFDPKSTMYQLIDKAELMIQQGARPAEALKVIEDYYDNGFVKLVHKFMDLGEMRIGDLAFKPLTQINFQDWVSDAESFNLTKGKIKSRNNIFTVGSLGLTWFTLNSMDMFKDAIAADPLYQGVTFIYFVVMVLQYLAISQITTGDWLKEL